MASAALAAPEGAPNAFTCRSLNGHAWQGMTEKERAVYLSGFSEALERAVQLAAHKGDLELYWPEGFSVGDAQAALGHFYQTPENLAIAEMIQPWPTCLRPLGSLFLLRKGLLLTSRIETAALGP